MPYKTILTILESPEDASLLMPIACDIAQEFKAHLICIRPSFELNIPRSVSTFMSKKLVKQLVEQDALTNQEIKKIFDAATVSQDFIAEYREEITAGGEKLTMIEKDAYRSDLVITSTNRWPKPTNMDIDPIHKLIMGTGLPVLVVPEGYKSKRIPQNILFAWRASAEASSAAHNAIGFMQRAKKTTIMTINEDGKTTAESVTEGHEMAAMLDRHGAKVNVWHAKLTQKSVGEQIAHEAKIGGHDLVVMGAGHHGFGYRLTHSDTAKVVIKNVTVPVLLSA